MDAEAMMIRIEALEARNKEPQGRFDEIDDQMGKRYDDTALDRRLRKAMEAQARKAIGLLRSAHPMECETLACIDSEWCSARQALLTSWEFADMAIYGPLSEEGTDG